MAKATAYCKCRDCGKEFVKTKICYNRKEADSWESYAKSNYTLCASCYGKKMIADEKAKGLYVEVRLDSISPYFTNSTEQLENSIVIIFFGDTFPYKDKIKELGGKWTDQYPEGFLADLFTMGDHSRLSRWIIRCSTENLEEKLKSVEAIGARIEKLPDKMEIKMHHAMEQETRKKLAEETKEREEKQKEWQKELDALGPLPGWPDEILAIWPKGGKWNGTVYGKGRYRVYFSGEEVVITAKQKKLFETTYAARQEWRKKKAEIENKYKEEGK